MFDVFRVPDIWIPYMSFSVGICFSVFPGTSDVSLCAKVLGMGWLSSVGIALHLIWELALRAPHLGAGLPPDRELVRSRSFPRGN